MSRLAPGFDCRPQERAGRALAVGSGDVEDGREIIFRIAEPEEQGADSLQP
jgi:hypothetical protein